MTLAATIMPSTVRLRDVSSAVIFTAGVYSVLGLAFFYHGVYSVLSLAFFYHGGVWYSGPCIFLPWWLYDFLGLVSSYQGECMVSCFLRSPTVGCMVFWALHPPIKGVYGVLRSCMLLSWGVYGVLGTHCHLSLSIALYNQQ